MGCDLHTKFYPGIPTTIKTMGVNITTIAYLRVLIMEIGSTIIFHGGGSPGFTLHVAICFTLYNTRLLYLGCIWDLMRLRELWSVDSPGKKQ